MLELTPRKGRKLVHLVRQASTRLLCPRNVSLARPERTLKWGKPAARCVLVELLAGQGLVNAVHVPMGLSVVLERRYVTYVLPESCSPHIAIALPPLARNTRLAL